MGINILRLIQRLLSRGGKAGEAALPAIEQIVNQVARTEAVPRVLQRGSRPTVFRKPPFSEEHAAEWGLDRFMQNSGLNADEAAAVLRNSNAEHRPPPTSYRIPIDNPDDAQSVLEAQRWWDRTPEIVRSHPDSGMTPPTDPRITPLIPQTAERYVGRLQGLDDRFGADGAQYMDQLIDDLASVPPGDLPNTPPTGGTPWPDPNMLGPRPRNTPEITAAFSGMPPQPPRSRIPINRDLGRPPTSPSGAARTGPDSLGAMITDMTPESMLGDPNNPQARYLRGELTAEEAIDLLFQLLFMK